jgi:hypothetical protein
VRGRTLPLFAAAAGLNDHAFTIAVVAVTSSFTLTAAVVGQLFGAWLQRRAEETKDTRALHDAHTPQTRAAIVARQAPRPSCAASRRGCLAHDKPAQLECISIASRSLREIAAIITWIAQDNGWDWKDLGRCRRRSSTQKCSTAYCV